MAITEYFEPFTVVIIFKFRKSKIRNEISEGGTATGSETEVIIDKGEYKRYKRPIFTKMNLLMDIKSHGSCLIKIRYLIVLQLNNTNRN